MTVTDWAPLAHERVETLRREAETVANEPHRFLFFVCDALGFVRFVSVIWDVIMLRFRQGGAPAKQVLEECDLLLTLIAASERHLGLIQQEWHKKDLSAEFGKPMFADVESAATRLDAVARDVRKIRAWAADSPRITADSDELKRRVAQADESNEWVGLREVIQQARRGNGPPTRE
jgi:hypothetical protein